MSLTVDAFGQLSYIIEALPPNKCHSVQLNLDHMLIEWSDWFEPVKASS
jgi:hypothetical protein